MAGSLKDYSRFDQIGSVSGWIKLGDEHIAVKDWFASSDHSWGIRTGMGGYEPLTRLPRPGENPRDVGAGHVGYLVVVLWFDTPSLAGYRMQIENGAGAIIYSYGRLLRQENGGFTERSTKRIGHDLKFFPGTRTATSGVIIVEADDGEIINIEVESLMHPIC